LKDKLDHLFHNNRLWAERMRALDPDFFAKLSGQQTPDYLWIGCSDSRVPANEIIGLMPGEVFVHRNVANVVVHTDLNCQSVIEFAVDQLRIKHIIVVGHYGCSGVLAAMARKRTGLSDNWLRHVQNVYFKHQQLLDAIADTEDRHDLLCELNVIEQVVNVGQCTAVQDAWERGQPLTVHGWIYRLRDGLLRDLRLAVEARDELFDAYAAALRALGARAG
jgi:carbonic anhydrase